MSEKLLVLERDILSDLEIVERLYTELGTAPVPDDEPQEALIVTAYRLHSLYNVLENIFHNIAQAFENTLDDRAGWHSQLLQRMLLDLSPLRPAVIDRSAYEKLDELRRFRHLFRAAYGVEFDTRRLALVKEKALELESLFREQIGKFLDFLRALRAGDTPA